MDSAATPHENGRAKSLGELCAPAPTDEDVGERAGSFTPRPPDPEEEEEPGGRGRVSSFTGASTPMLHLTVADIANKRRSGSLDDLDDQSECCCSCCHYFGDLNPKVWGSNYLDRLLWVGK